MKDLILEKSLYMTCRSTALLVENEQNKKIDQTYLSIYEVTPKS